MSSTINADNGVVSGTSGLKSTADTSGVLALQSNGTTALTINTDLSATFAGAVTASSFSGTTTTATNLAGGSNGTIPYQSASGTTQMLAAGTSGQVLTSNGAAAPTWATPAPGAGTVTAVASGALPNGSTVILNSDGTISVPSATGTDSTTDFASAITSSSSAINTANRSISAVYGSKDNIIVIFYIGPSNYLYAMAGKISGTTISFGTPNMVNSSNACAADPAYGIHASYDYINNAYFCVWRWSATGYGGLTRVMFNTALSLSGSTYNNSYAFATGNIYPTGYCLIISPTLNGSNNQGMLIWKANSVDQLFVAGIQVTNSAPYMNFGSDVFVINSPGSYQMLPTFCDVPSKALIAYCHPSGYPMMSVISLNGASATANTAVQINTDNAKNMGVVASYSAKLNKYFVGWSNSTTAVRGCVVTVSGTTPTAGTVANISGFSTGSSGNYLYSCVPYEITGEFWFCVDRFASRISISGTTFTNGSIQTISNAQFPNQMGNWFYDSANYTLVYPSSGSSNYYQQLTFGTAYTTNLTNTNFIGFSSGAYTNGQTATVSTVGSTNSAVSGLTTASGYYVAPDGTLSTAVTSNYAGVALSATKILVKG